MGGVEVNIFIAGRLTTRLCGAAGDPRSRRAGSTDAAIVYAEGQITTVHLTGGGEYGQPVGLKPSWALEDLSLAEAIKIPASQSGKPVQYSSREWRGGVLSGSPQPGGVRQSGG